MSARFRAALDSRYSHDLLLHEDDESLIRGTRAFVEQGLSSGGQVLVHGDEPRVALMRSVLGEHECLHYGLDSELYRAPISTLFAYQRSLAEHEVPGELWATGTVPFGEHTYAGWARYESLVNEALVSYAYHGLCTYDTRSLPPSVIAAARATHPSISTGGLRNRSNDYLAPADFLQNAMSAAPGPPLQAPSVSARLHELRDLARARDLVRRSATAHCAAPAQNIENFIIAVNEVLANGIVHGAPPVDLTLWVGLTTMTCVVEDSGPGIPDPLAGYRYPGPSGPMGLWAARQLCSEVFVSNRPEGGCSVLLEAA